MERKGQNAAKVLILVPFITVLICMMIIPVWLSGIVTLMGSSFQYVWWLFLLCAAFSMTIGFIMAIIGFIMAIRRKMKQFIVIGTVVISVILTIYIWLFIVIFVRHGFSSKAPLTTIPS